MITYMDKIEYIKLPLFGKWGSGKHTLVDGDYDGEYFRQYKWYLGKNGYVWRNLNGKFSYLHDEVCYKPKGKWVDHINRDKLDNRSFNLRAVSPAVNSSNRSSEGYRRKRKKDHDLPLGVSRVSSKHPKTGKIYYANTYKASFRGKYLGSFTDSLEAGKIYQKTKEQYYKKTVDNTA